MDDLSQKKFFKITNKKENHHGFQYTDGLNILKEPFAEKGSCVAGGLYFTDINNIFEFLNFGIYLREITLPFDDPDFKIVKDRNKWRANKIILGKRYNLWEKETFEYLVSIGANVHAFSDFPLSWASGNGYLDVVKYLVSIGANVHVDNEYPLMYASVEGRLEVVKYLISVGANIHANNDSAIRHASEEGHLDVVKYLISVGANIHANNDSAIKHASEEGHLDVVKYLVAMGADIHSMNNYAVKYASKEGHTDVVNYLVSLGAKLS